MYCLQCFSSENILKDHKENCVIINGKKGIKMPSKDEKVFYKNSITN